MHEHEIILKGISSSMITKCYDGGNKISGLVLHNC